MRTIHEFTLIFADEQIVDIPGFISVLSVATQNGSIVVCCNVCDPPVPEHCEKRFVVLETGKDCEILQQREWKFLGTVHTHNSKLQANWAAMWHVFYEAEKPNRRAK